MILFTSALTIWGLSVIPFFLALRTLFAEQNVEKFLSTIGSILGVIVGIGLIGIAYTPADVLGLLHIIFVYIAYLSLFVLGILYSITLFKTKVLVKQYAIIFLIWTVLFFFTLSMGIVGQKIGRFSTIFCFACVGYGAWKLEKT
jgi:hypothetical protein